VIQFFRSALGRSFLKERLILTAICLFLFSGCETKPSQLKPPLRDQGEVFMYMEPVPQEAAHLRFFLDGISAVRADGSEVPLTMSFTEFRFDELNRQRLVASGIITEGPYSGISITVRKALLKGEEGEGDLIIPKEPYKIDFPFTAQNQKALVISLNLKYSQSVIDGYSFIPSFSLSIPAKPLIALKGIVSNHDSNTLAVFDKRAGRVVSVIETGAGPAGIAFDQRARKAYFTTTEDDSVEVIDLDSEDIINRIRLNAGDRPLELVLSPDGSVLFVANSGSDSVSIINTSTLLEQTRLTVGFKPMSILLDRTGRKAFVFNALSNTISVIDVPNRSVSSTITTEQGPVRGQFNRRGDRLFVIFEGSPYLIVLDPFNFAIVKRVFVGAGVSALKVDTNTDMLYLGRRYDSFIEVYDPFSIMPTEAFDAGGGVGYMTIDNEGNNLLAVLPDRKSLVTVNLVSKKIISEIDIGDSPFWTAIMGER
jgi:YVTN family beta-propeller protein